MDTSGSVPPPVPGLIPWLEDSKQPAPAQAAAPAPIVSHTDPPAAPLANRKPLDNRRVIAHVIDLVLIWIPSYLGAQRLFPHRPELEVLGVAMSVYLTYFFICEATTGQTIGKRLTGLKVMRKDGGPAGAQAVAARTVLRVLEDPIIALIVMVLSGKRRQRLGDLLGGTIVARAEDCRERPAPSPLRLVYPVLWIGAAVAFLVLDPVTSAIRGDFERGLREGLTYRGASAAYIDCVVQGSRSAVTDDELNRLAGTYSRTGYPDPGTVITPDESARMQDVITTCRAQAP